jgi:hypothetical protein
MVAYAISMLKILLVSDHSLFFRAGFGALAWNCSIRRIPRQYNPYSKNRDSGKSRIVTLNEVKGPTATRGARYFASLDMRVLLAC